MRKDPLHTTLCESLGIEYPIVSFTHCKDVAAAVINAGAFAVLGQTQSSPDEIAANIKWLREKVGDKPFGVDLVFPASGPAHGSPEELIAQIPKASGSSPRTSSGATRSRRRRRRRSSTSSAG